MRQWTVEEKRKMAESGCRTNKKTKNATWALFVMTAHNRKEGKQNGVTVRTIKNEKNTSMRKKFAGKVRNERQLKRGGRTDR